MQQWCNSGAIAVQQQCNIYIVNMDLLCIEGTNLKQAFRDPVFLRDSRVLTNLLKLEDAYMVAPGYMQLQEDIKPHMRRTVAQWMLEVSAICRAANNIKMLYIYFLLYYLCYA